MKQNHQNKLQLTELQQTLLRALPGVDTVLGNISGHEDLAEAPVSVLTAAARQAVDFTRETIRKTPEVFDNNERLPEIVYCRARELALKEMTPKLDAVVNATGVVVHTNLGRSPLAPAAIEHLVRVARGYANLEFDLERGRRGIRYACVESLLCRLTDAEAALVVNNNAGAVLLALESLARNREVLVSRGELVEIGGSFRIPDVMSKSGGILCEVGTTNRTHPADYENAITENTALLLKVHASNYSIVGFSAEVSLTELVAMGQKHHLPVMYDLGSGTLIDFRKYGLQYEPTVMETVAAGADVITFSGDKLLGGPQAGIIVGKKAVVDRLKRNPLTRALRIDKLTLTALEMTLRAYQDKEKAVRTLPTLNMLTMSLETVTRKAEQLRQRLQNCSGKLTIALQQTFSRPGGGSLPLQEIPTMAVALQVAGLSAAQLEVRMRQSHPPVIGRIDDDVFLLDMRTVAESELSVIAEAVEAVLASIEDEGENHADI